jgi:hypothetical protein
MVTSEPRQIHAKPRHQWVTVKQAAIHYGTSESDIRRRIKREELVAEITERPGGTLLRVRIDAPHDTARPEDEAAPDTHQPTPEPRQDMAAAIAAAVAPLVERLAVADAHLLAGAEARQVQIETIASLREQRARLETERDAARQHGVNAAREVDRLAAELERERRRSWWDRLRGV